MQNTRFYPFLFVIALIFKVSAMAQTGVISGRVFDAINNDPLPFSNVILEGTDRGVVTDEEGRFQFDDLEPGLYRVQASFIGYKPKVIDEVRVTQVTAANLNIGLDLETTVIQAVELVANPFESREESPTSVQRIGVNEIQRNPGANQDISIVVQTLPGVASTPSFRNDLIIRGGAPNENRFYLDGIEIPTINHFATQGSSGGPVGMINVNLIEGVELYTGAFPAERGNALSSVMDIKFKEGRSDRVGSRFQLGASEVGITSEGPLGENTTFVASVRRSYLQFLFAALELPFLPTYNDLQFKVKHRFNQRNEITMLGIGALDQFVLNTDANGTPEQRYILNNLPTNNQWNYTLGLKYTRYRDRGYTNVVLSRSHLNNQAYRYADNIETPENLILDYKSNEIEGKLRIETVSRREGWKLLWGVGAERTYYDNRTTNRRYAGNEVIDIRYETELYGFKYAAFASASRSMGRWNVAGSLRMDGFDYSSATSNPLDQFSPRIAVKYNLNSAWSLNFNTGIYYQLPPYTLLGYKNTEGELVNRASGIRSIQSGQLVAGVTYLTPFSSKVSLEAFHKSYDHYPLLTRDSIALANLGSDFGVIGNEPASPDAEGRAYGVEFLYQQKLSAGYYGLFSYTFVRSEFTNGDGEFIPSSWDNRHLISMVGGKKFNNDWEVGFRWRFLGGAPYTPYDEEASSLQTVWDVTGRGVFDYSAINSLRNGAYQQLDFRVDKKWYFEKWNLNVYFDVQNAYGFQLEGQPFIDVVRDDQGLPVTDPDDSSRYLLTTLENTSGTLLPSIGVIIDF